MKTDHGFFLPIVLACLLAGPASAQSNFEQLPPREQNLLKAAVQVWPKLDDATRLQLRAQAQHWLGLSAAEQQTLLLKQRQWDSLSFADKSKERARHAAWQSLGAIDQAKLGGAYRQWRKLPVEQQEALRAKFARQLPEYRQAWMLGPSLGRQARELNEWLLFMPQEQIRPWLELLRELDGQQRADLVRLGKRLNQQQRDTFRTRLLSAPAGARTDLIGGALQR